MSQLVFSSLTLLCCMSVIWTNPDRTLNCDEKAYVVNNSPTLWFEAHILCQQNGMEMATVESSKEEEQLEIELNKLRVRGKGDRIGYWTSGVRRKSAPELVWFVNGKPLVYGKWSYGQPDNYKNNEACIQIFVDDKQNEILWNDFNCDQKMGYICQTYVRNLTCESISKSTRDFDKCKWFFGCVSQRNVMNILFTIF